MSPFASRTVKITLSILFIAFSLGILLHIGSIDDFAPKTMAQVQEVVVRGFISEGSDASIIPGFNVLGASLVMIMGLPVDSLFYIPIQTIPFILVSFLLFLEISRSKMMASVVTLLLLISGTDGSSTFFWPHGLGYILFFMIAYLIIKITKYYGRLDTSGLIILIILSEVALVFISYDVTAIMLLFIASFVTIIFLLGGVLKHQVSQSSRAMNMFSGTLLTLLLILIVAELGLSDFFYTKFADAFSETNVPPLSVLENFFSAYFSSANTSSPISDLNLSYPSPISILNLVKYGFLMLSIPILLVTHFRPMRSEVGKPMDASPMSENIDLNKVITYSFILCGMLYAIPRLLIGHFSVALFFYPGLVATVFLFTKSHLLRKWGIFVIAIMLVLTASTYYVCSENDLIKQDLDGYNDLGSATYWHFEHLNGSTTATDQMTSNFFALNLARIDGNLDYGLEAPLVLSENDVLFLLGRTNQTNTAAFIINYDLRSVELNNWVSLEPWIDTKVPIAHNPRLEKIYSSSHLETYVLAQSNV